jgi:hypothetical protein
MRMGRNDKARKPNAVGSSCTAATQSKRG